ncbi:hypothetical protein [Legionella sp. W05-934-2]|uniref:hypothetical protein n=1 Tax=Legionella sp. W05-934-2 TaxID=1198649 RepID=UPI003462CC8B
MNEKSEVKVEVEVTRTSSKLILNYHKHPEVGGVGHVSIECTHNEETVKLSVYPQSDLSPFTPLAIASFNIFPIMAVNHPNIQKSDSPIHASYDLSEMVINMEAAMEEIKLLNEKMESGNAHFSLTPNVVTQGTATILNKNTSTARILLGMKTYDKELIEEEREKVEVINCAESICRVLEAAGIKRPKGILSYPTPSGINTHFAAIMANDQTTEKAPEQSQPSETKAEPTLIQNAETMVAAKEESKTTATKEEPSLLGSIYNNICSAFSFFTSQSIMSVTATSAYEISHNDDTDWRSNDSDYSTSSDSDYYWNSDNSSTTQATETSTDTSNVDTSYSSSTSTSESFISQRTEEDDSAYLTRMDNMIN